MNLTEMVNKKIFLKNVVKFCVVTFHENCLFVFSIKDYFTTKIDGARLAYPVERQTFNLVVRGSVPIELLQFFSFPEGSRIVKCLFS